MCYVQKLLAEVCSFIQTLDIPRTFFNDLHFAHRNLPVCVFPIVATINRGNIATQHEANV